MAHLNFVLCFFLFTCRGTVGETEGSGEMEEDEENSSNATISPMLKMMELLLKMDADINTMRDEFTNETKSLEEKLEQLANKLETQGKSDKTGKSEIATSTNSTVPVMSSSEGLASTLTTTDSVGLASTLTTSSVSLASTLITSTTFLSTLEPSPTFDIDPNEPDGTATDETDEINYEPDDEPEAVSNSLLSVTVAIVILLVLGLLIYVSYQYRYQVCV